MINWSLKVRVPLQKSTAAHYTNIFRPSLVVERTRTGFRPSGRGRIGDLITGGLDGVRLGATVGPAIEHPQPPAPVALPLCVHVQRVTLPRDQDLRRHERVTVDAKLEV